MAAERAEAVVLGAGIAGCALAFHLAARSVGPIVVFDPQTPGAGATGRAAGIVTEQLWDRWDVEVTRASKAEYAALAARWDPTAYAVNGFVRWTRRPEVAEALARSVERLEGWGVRSRRLTTDELAAHFPAGRFDGVIAASGCVDDAVVTPSTMAQIYAEGARAHGVDFWLGQPLSAFRKVGDAWQLTSGGRTVHASRAVVAAGAWSKRLLADLGHPLPLAPYRTQAAILRPSPGVPPDLPSAHDLDSDVYVRPEQNGRVLAGDGTEHVEVDPETFRTGGDDAFVAHVAETFADRFPAWAEAELVRAWAGVCASTPDRRPLIGPVPRADGLYVLAGFNGFGVMRAGGAASRLAAVLGSADADRELGRLAPVDPRRFAGWTGTFSPRPGFTLEGGDDPRF